MNIIFLDIDGVLNSRQSMLKKHQTTEYPITKIEDKTTWPDPILVSRLNKIIEITDSNIVISSVWRSLGLDRIIEILEKVGVKSKVIGITAKLSGLSRGEEIQNWLDFSSQVITISNFVILDDDSDMPGLESNLVKTDNEVGLQDEDVEKAIEILNRK